MTMFSLSLISFFGCYESSIIFKLSFVANGEVIKSIDTSGQEIISIPENPKLDGYTFDGWFWDNGKWEKPFTANSLLDTTLSSDMSVYAKFSEIHIHSYSETVIEPTCTEKGYTVYNCTCGDEYIDNYVDELGHKYNDGIIQREATYFNSGSKMFTCQRCDNTKVETISQKEIDKEKYDSGTYKVGDDLPIGDYILFSKQGNGYFSFSSDINKNDILLNNNFGYLTYITAYEDTYLYLSRCIAIPYNNEIVFNPINIEIVVSGVFKVGKDIPTGMYILISETQNGYFSILSGTEGSNIISNDNFGYITYIKSNDNTYLEISRCKIIPFSDEVIYNPVDKGYVTGTYLVGKDLVAGEYKLSSISGGYYAIYDEPQGKIVSNDLFGKGEVTVTLKTGQYIEFSKTKVELIK